MSLDQFKPRVVVLGGGYAGLSAVWSLPKHVFHVVLVDRRPAFLDVVKLHQTIHRPVSDLESDYATLAKRHDFEFHRGQVAFEARDLVAWGRRGRLPVGDGEIPFDYLLVSTGHTPRPPRATTTDQRDLAQLQDQGASTAFHSLFQGADDAGAITVVGAGPTGVQFVFELDAWLRQRGRAINIQWVNAGPTPLAGFPEGVVAAVDAKIRATPRIDYFPSTRLVDSPPGQVILEGPQERFTLPSRLTWLFPGLMPAPEPLTTNSYGQVVVDGREVVDNVFAAGDCARFDGVGLNRLSAQAALRKGAAAAENLRAVARNGSPTPYTYQEQGYVVHLGPNDGVGWLLDQANVIRGAAAIAAKAAVEAQFALRLEGVTKGLVNLWSSVDQQR
ncbi:MAG: NAD(P)/FAD-dependent oxidoreductase [Candidatus Competibacterales bacterium]